MADDKSAAPDALEGSEDTQPEPTTPETTAPSAGPAPAGDGVSTVAAIEANENALASARPDEPSNYDQLTDIKAAEGPFQPSSIGSDGIERFVGPAADSNWSPAKTEPSEAEVAHHQAVMDRIAQRREERLNG